MYICTVGSRETVLNVKIEDMRPGIINASSYIFFRRALETNQAFAIGQMQLLTIPHHNLNEEFSSESFSLKKSHLKNHNSLFSNRSVQKQAPLQINQ